MATSLLPPPKEIHAIVEEALVGIGGRISESVRHRGRLFIHATVPHTRQVRPNDHVQGGVAVVAGKDISVHPYVFRQVFRSGAVMARARGVTRLKRIECEASSQSLIRLRKRLRAFVQDSASSETLAGITSQLRAAALTKVDVALQMSAVISRIPRRHSSLLLSQILSEFHEDQDGDGSVYALMNAVATVARDEEDPEITWELEELAGSVPALLPIDPQVLATAEEFVAVG